MNLNRLSEFFEDSDGRLSMTRLLSFITIFPASWVMFEHPMDTYATYLSVYMLGYVGGALAKGLSGPSVVNTVGRANTVNQPVADKSVAAGATTAVQ